MKKFLLLNCLLLCFIFVGCNKLINVKSENTTIKITEVYYKEAYETKSFIIVDRLFVPITNSHPETFKVYVMHENHEHILSGESIYNYCKDKVGTTIETNEIIYEYDDGTYKHDIEIK